MKPFLILLVVGQSFLATAQTNLKETKGLKTLLHQKIHNYSQNAYKYGLEKKFDSAFFYFNKALRLSTEIDNPELIAHSKLVNSRILYWQGKIDTAKYSIKPFTENKTLNDSIKIFAHFLLGEIYNYEKNYVQALKHYILSIEKRTQKQLHLTKRDSVKIASSLFRIGNIHYDLKNIEQAKSYYNKSLLLIKNTNFKSAILFKVSTLHEETKNIPEAIQYSLRATKIAAKNKWQLMLPTYYKGLSSYYLQEAKSDSAIYYAKKGLLNNTYCRLNGLNRNIGKGYLLNKNYSKAIRYFTIALKYTTPEETLDIYGMLREAYTKTRKYKKALLVNDKFLTLNDSLNKLKVKQEVVAITEKYESDKKQLKIKNLNEKDQLNKSVIKKQKTQIILFVLLFVFSTIILSLVLFFNIKRKKQRNLLYIKNRALAKKVEKQETLNKNNSNNGGLKKNELHHLINTLIDAEFYLDKEITLSKMAKGGSTNTTYLSKIINEDYNKSFTNFINDLRISYTLRKLETSLPYRKLTIEDIGEKAGFSSINAFYRAFRKYTGLTPSYYIKRTLQQD